MGSAKNETAAMPRGRPGELLRCILDQIKKCCETLLYIVPGLIFILILYKAYSETVLLHELECERDIQHCDFATFVSLFFGSPYAKAVDLLWGSLPQALLLWAFQWARMQINYHHRVYEDSNVLGWNVLVEDKVTGKFKLEMPTEDTFSLNEMMKGAGVILDRVKAAAALSRSTVVPGNYPDFMILLEDPDDQHEFMRRVRNRVSQSIKGSLWPKYAMSRLKKKDRDVNPWVLPVQEKDEGMRARTMRTWLVFPSVLRTILRYSEDELKDSSENGKFIVSAEHHRIRLLNLRKWAVAEFEENLDKRYLSAEIILPKLS